MTRTNLSSPFSFGDKNPEDNIQNTLSHFKSQLGTQNSNSLPKLNEVDKFFHSATVQDNLLSNYKGDELLATDRNLLNDSDGQVDEKSEASVSSFRHELKEERKEKVIPMTDKKKAVKSART